MIDKRAYSSASDGNLPSLNGATHWLNSSPLTLADLSGKVVLIDFWTYTCINWLRTLPYIRAWAEKYHDQGLVVIGVHSPEFPFERNIDNLHQAVRDLKVTFPVAVDNDYAIWNAFSNHYWPTLYLTDAQGTIHYHAVGEGHYEQTEHTIQNLLGHAIDANISTERVTVNPQGVEASPDWGNLQSPENYTGYARTRNFASPGGEVLDEPHHYAAPAQVRLNAWALAGDWTMLKGFVRLDAVNGRIFYRFHARDLHLVMGPTHPGTSVHFQVRLDGASPNTAQGEDVDAQGHGIVRQQRLYQLIRQSQPIEDRLFEITFFDAGVEVYVFTFG